MMSMMNPANTRASFDASAIFGHRFSAFLGGASQVVSTESENGNATVNDVGVCKVSRRTPDGFVVAVAPNAGRGLLRAQAIKRISAARKENIAGLAARMRQYVPAPVGRVLDYSSNFDATGDVKDDFVGDGMSHFNDVRSSEIRTVSVVFLNLCMSDSEVIRAVCVHPPSPMI
jgi:hypothetical protein